jgi:phosphatidylglycerophosphate synthase
MTGSRWRLPGAPLRTSVLSAAGCGLAGLVGLSLMIGPWIGTGPLYRLKALVIFGAMMTASLGVVEARHPFPRFGPANYVTTSRVMLMALVAALIGEGATPDILWCAVGATALVAALDGVDGWLARRSRMASDFGAQFDMETDALLIMALSILVWAHGKAGIWVLLCGAMRYLFVGAGWLFPWLARPLRSSRRGKTVAIGQLAGLSVAVMPVVPVPLSAAVAAVTLAALGWSFAIDVAWLSRHYRVSQKE